MTNQEEPLPPHTDHITGLMLDLMTDSLHHEHVSIGHILDVFGTRGFAFLLLVLSLLNIVIFMIPLISLLFGIPMIILAAQMVLGMPAPIFPQVIRERMVPREPLIKGLQRAIAGVERAERYVRPRLMALSQPPFNHIHGVFALIMAIMVAIPIPLINAPPSVALAMLAIGMLEKDGAFIICAYVLGAWCLFLFESLGHAVHSL